MGACPKTAGFPVRTLIKRSTFRETGSQRLQRSKSTGHVQSPIARRPILAAARLQYRKRSMELRATPNPVRAMHFPAQSSDRPAAPGLLRHLAGQPAGSLAMAIPARTRRVLIADGVLRPIVEVAANARRLTAPLHRRGCFRRGGLGFPGSCFLSYLIGRLTGDNRS